MISLAMRRTVLPFWFSAPSPKRLYSGSCRVADSETRRLSTGSATSSASIPVVSASPTKSTTKMVSPVTGSIRASEVGKSSRVTW